MSKISEHPAFPKSKALYVGMQQYDWQPADAEDVVRSVVRWEFEMCTESGKNHSGQIHYTYTRRIGCPACMQSLCEAAGLKVQNEK